MEQQPTFAGIGSVAYIIRKDDLLPDSMTPKEGKTWTKVKLADQQTVIDAAPTDAQPASRGFRQSYDLSFDVKYKPNRRIRSNVEYSAENLQDCERLLRTWRPRLIARKKLLRAGLRLTRAVHQWLKQQEPSVERTMAIMDVEQHIRRFHLLLGQKVLVAVVTDPDHRRTYAIYNRLHRRKVICRTVKARYVTRH